MSGSTGPMRPMKRPRSGRRPCFRLSVTSVAAVLAVVILAAGTPAAFAAGNRERTEREAVLDVGPNADRLTVLSGTIRLVGNEPFVQPVLTGADGTGYRFDENDVERFRALAGLAVVVECVVNERTLSSADGMYRTVERTLQQVRLQEIR